MRDRFIPDTRIHCCLFFINPTGHTLKPVSQTGFSNTEKSDADVK